MGLGIQSGRLEINPAAGNDLDGLNRALLRAAGRDK